MKSLATRLNEIDGELVKSIDAIFDAYFLLSEKNIVLEYNITEECIRSYLKDGDIHGRNFFDVLTTDTNLEELGELERKISERVPHSTKLNLSLEKKKNYYDVLTFLMSGETTFITFVNIDEYQKKEQKLRESEAKYRHLFNNTPYAIWLVDLRGRILDCNKNMNKFMSVFKAEDLIGKPFREVIEMFRREGDPRNENLNKVMRERFIRLLKKGYIAPFEFEMSRGDGKTFWITLESSFVDMEGEKIIQLFIKDITDKKQSELELESLRKDLDNRIKQRTLKLESSEMKYRKAYNRAKCFKGLFTHDISNMFQTISNSLELCEALLKEGIETDNLMEYFALIDQQLRRGKKLIKNVRNLSELEESEMPLVPVEVHETLHNAIQFTRVNFPKKNVKILIEPEEGEINVMANELLLDVFENILINSIVYNNNEKIRICVAISTTYEDDQVYVRLEFKDNGWGIKDSEKDKIFKEDHYKSSNSKGMGLGLSLVAKLIDLCAGKIWVEDRIQGDSTKGSNFIILIPRAQEKSSQ